MEIKLVTVAVVLRLNDIVQHIIRYRRKKMPCHLQTKQAMARANLGVGPGDPGPPLLWFIKYLNIIHFQYGIQTFAKFKRPECTR